ncbi:MAG: hypothetical protein RL885_22985 [Planctomycetota bacterium]
MRKETGVELHPAESLVRSALHLAEERCRSLGFESYWQRFCEHTFEDVSYATLGVRHGMRPARAASQVRIARRLFRAALRHELRREQKSGEAFEGAIQGLVRSLDHDPGSFEDLAGDRVCLLLAMGLEQPSQPLDLLVGRLIEPDGSAWLSEVLRYGPTATFGPPRRTLVQGTADIRELLAIKEMCKTYFQVAPRSSDRLAALVGYFLTVAAALSHYGELITRQSARKLDEAFWDLTSALPDPWSELASSAVERLAECAGGRTVSNEQLRHRGPGE